MLNHFGKKIQEKYLYLQSPPASVTPSATERTQNDFRALTNIECIRKVCSANILKERLMQATFVQK